MHRGSRGNESRILARQACPRYGHTGFKGAWLSFWLQHLGADVTAYALASCSSPSLFDLLRLQTRIHSVEGDVRDLNQLKAVMEEARPQIVFHLAAQSLVRASYRDPLYTYSTNVMGTVNVLEAVRQVGDVKVLVNVTSDKCYQNQERVKAYAESDPLGGRDPYSSSKGCAELITAAYRDSFFSGVGRVARSWPWPRLEPEMSSAAGIGPKIASFRTASAPCLGRCRSDPEPQRNPPVAARPRAAPRLPGPR